MGLVFLVGFELGQPCAHLIRVCILRFHIFLVGTSLLDQGVDGTARHLQRLFASRNGASTAWSRAGILRRCSVISVIRRSSFCSSIRGDRFCFNALPTLILAKAGYGLTGAGPLVGPLGLEPRTS